MIQAPPKSRISALTLDRWFFADTKGEPTPIGEADLRSGLHLGTIHPSSFVWRPGWKTWLPADHVRQFEKARGEHYQQTLEPRVDLKQQQPPPVPIPEASAPSHRSTPIPTAPWPKPLAHRPPAPTIADDASNTGGSTLRPPGAVPPPPRGVPKSLLADGQAWSGRNVESPEAPDTPPDLGEPSHRPSATSIRRDSVTPEIGTGSQIPVPKDVNDSIPDVPREELSAPQHSTSALPTVPYDPDGIASPPSSNNLRTGAWARKGPSKRSKRITYAAVLLALASLVLGFWLTLRIPRHTPRAQTIPTASS